MGLGVEIYMSAGLHFFLGAPGENLYLAFSRFWKFTLIYWHVVPSQQRRLALCFPRDIASDCSFPLSLIKTFVLILGLLSSSRLFLISNS